MELHLSRSDVSALSDLLEKLVTYYKAAGDDTATTAASTAITQWWPADLQGIKPKLHMEGSRYMPVIVGYRLDLIRQELKAQLANNS